MRGRWKLLDVVGELSDDLFRAAPGDAGNRVDTVERGRHRLCRRGDSTIEVANLGFEKLEMGEQTAQQERVVLREASDEHLFQRLAFIFEAPQCQPGQSGWLTLPGDEGLEHRPAGRSEHLGNAARSGQADATRPRRSSSGRSTHNRRRNRVPWPTSRTGPEG